MKKNIRAILLFVFTLMSFSFISCNSSIEDQLKHSSLKLVTVESPLANAIDPTLKSMTVIDYIQTSSVPFPPEESFVHFYDHGIASYMDNDNYLSGRWSYSKKDSMLQMDISNGSIAKKLRLKLVNKDAENFKFRVIEFNRVSDINKIKLRDIDNFMIYTKSNHYDEGNKDLMALNENKWRIKPAKKESDAELKQRLAAQLQYHLDYFKLTKDKGQDYFETRFLQSPFNFYQHALGIAENEDLREKWIEIFYDRVDAERAAAILRTAINSTEVPKASGDYTDTYRELITKMIKVLKI